MLNYLFNRITYTLWIRFKKIRSIFWFPYNNYGCSVWLRGIIIQYNKKLMWNIFLINSSCWYMLISYLQYIAAAPDQGKVMEGLFVPYCSHCNHKAAEQVMSLIYKFLDYQYHYLDFTLSIEFRLLVLSELL